MRIAFKLNKKKLESANAKIYSRRKKKNQIHTVSRWGFTQKSYAKNASGKRKIASKYNLPKSGQFSDRLIEAFVSHEYPQIFKVKFQYKKERLNFKVILHFLPRFQQIQL